MSRSPDPSGRGPLTAWIALLRRRGRALTLLGLAITLVLGSGLARLQVHNPASKYDLPPDDPVRRTFDAFEERFGGQETLVVGFALSDVLGPAERERIDRIREELSGVPGVSGAPLTLTAPDSRAVGVVLEFSTRGLDDLEKSHTERRLVEGVRTALEPHRAAFAAVHVAGLPVIDVAFEEALQRDLRVFGILSAVFALLVLLLLFRAWLPVMLASGTAAVSLVWSLGILGLAGTPLSMGLSMMIPLILVLGTAYSVHYLSHLCRGTAGDGEGTGREGEGAGADPLEAMVRDVLPPSVLTALTTAGGFFALTTSGLPAVREVGVYMGLAVLATLVVTSGLLPALLFGWRLVPPPEAVERLPARTARAMGRAIVGRTGTVIGLTALLTAAGAVGLTRVHVDSNHLFYFPADHPVREAYAFADSAFGGSVPLEVLVEAPRDRTADLVAGTRRLARAAERIEGVGSVLSPLDLLPPPAGRIGLPGRAALRSRLEEPATWEAVARTPAGARMVEADGEEIAFRTTLRGEVQGTEGMGRVVASVEEAARAAYGDLDVTLTGMMPVFVRTLDYIVESQLTSFGLAFGVIVILLVLLTRSLRLGALAAASNLVPVILVLGAMGWAGIPLDISTVMIASVVLGIVVDDTVHFLYRFLRERERGGSVDRMIRETYRRVGAPLVISTLVFCGGFFALLPSSFVPITHFGLLSGLTVLAALVGDLLLLPALLRVFVGWSEGRRGSPPPGDVVTEATGVDA